MSVYLGTFGKVELRRKADRRDFFATIQPADVDVSAKRFGLSVTTEVKVDPDQNYTLGELITGDEVRFVSTAVPGQTLSFISGYQNADATYHLYVDEVGGIRLYDTFAKAVNGLKADAVALAVPTNNEDIPVRLMIRNSERTVLAQVSNYELNTERETVDTTSLSDEFRSRISTLMSGSGRMTCFWEYTGDTTKELPNYLVELVLRTRLGSSFHARFYLKAPGYNPGGVADREEDEVFYDFDAVITSCAVQFATDNVVQITADFITTGKVELKMLISDSDAIVQEDGGKIPLENGAFDTGVPRFDT
tara:strand:+ start:929 stop:1846 length:918 start_codon:yes stop_codon:yes gene_type:complete